MKFNDIKKKYFCDSEIEEETKLVYSMWDDYDEFDDYYEEYEPEDWGYILSDENYIDPVPTFKNKYKVRKYGIYYQIKARSEYKQIDLDSCKSIHKRRQEKIDKIRGKIDAYKMPTFGDLMNIK